MSKASSMDCRVGQLEAVRDHVADALDDMAALAQHWAKNRERGRNPSAIRAAMLMVAREALAHVDQQEPELQRRMDEICGPAAYARNNSMCGKCGHPEACAAMGCKQPNAELCGGPSGPSERAPGYASAPKTEE